MQSNQGTQGIQGIFGPATIPAGQSGTPVNVSITDNGKFIAATGTVTINNTLITGMNTVIYNNSISPITIAKGTATNLRLAGTTRDGDRTLQGRGLATVLCTNWISGTTFDYVISGAGLL